MKSSPSPTPFHVAIYARVSSDRQAAEHTIESQVAALRERVAQAGHPFEEARCFLDDGVSGTTLRRPALERLRDLAAVGGIQKLYIHSPDRLARNYAYQVLLMDELRKQGVEVEFLNRPLGVSPEEDLLLQMQGMFAEYERAKIIERSRRGKRHAANRGCVSVLGAAPYGYRYLRKQDRGGDAAYEIHEEQAAVVRQIFEWIGRDRLSIGEATRRLRDRAIPTPKGQRVWDRSSVWGMLKNPAYQGTARFGKTRIGVRRPQAKRPRGQSPTPRRNGSIYDTDPGEQIVIGVPAIVSEELFATVQEQLDQNQRHSRERRDGVRHLLQGLVECACCGYAYSGSLVRRHTAQGPACYGYYRCVGTDAFRFGGQRVCTNKQVRLDKLDEAVWNDACELLRHPDLLRQEYERRLAVPEDSPGETSLKKRWSHAQRSLNRLIDAYTDGIVNRDEFEPRLQRARKRAAELESALQTLQSQTREQAALHEALACLDRFAETIRTRLDQTDQDTRREILRTLIDRVVVDTDQVRIVYRISFPLFLKNRNNRNFSQLCWRLKATASGTLLY
jgi:site-specific DNA recombinase